MSLSDNIWWTRKCRIQTEKRLLSNAFQAQVVLLWYSFFSVIIAIYFLKFDPSSAYSDVVWVAFSVLILCVSGFINGLSFKERAALVKECYEALQKIYQKSLQEDADIDEIKTEYEQVLNACENHSDRDYHFALCDTYLNTTKSGRDNLTKHPTTYSWVMFTWKHVLKLLTLVFVYLLPIALIASIEYLNGCNSPV